MITKKNVKAKILIFQVKTTSVFISCQKHCITHSLWSQMQSPSLPQSLHFQTSVSAVFCISNEKQCGSIRGWREKKKSLRYFSSFFFSLIDIFVYSTVITLGCLSYRFCTSWEAHFPRWVKSLPVPEPGTGRWKMTCMNENGWVHDLNKVNQVKHSQSWAFK